MVDDLSGLIKNTTDATILVPLIKEYLDISVKNDEQLIKLADIVQKLLRAESKNAEVSGAPGFLTEEEKSKLLSDAIDYHDHLRIQSQQDAERFNKLEEQLKDATGKVD